MQLARRIGAILGAVTIAHTSQAQSINFDNVTAPCNFNQTTQLTNLYAGLGVTFGGAGGGAILNQCGNFGINARSGVNFLAFNTVTYATGPQEIFFAGTGNSFSLFVGAREAGSFTARAFDQSNTQIGIQTVNAAAATWTALTLNVAGTRRIQLSSDRADWVADDLSFQQTTVIPEPHSYALLAAGMVGLGIATRRRRRAHG
ncbi:MAG: PEP-CTERM sorting domain-containing protein [Gemmatimonadaceae bacterium]|jgi:hypothetical protein|nr:PEP-CTERM sorting domain-containing protein [Gemmatimonadaceae bacterium]